MELKAKYVLPKTQMIINGLLSQVESSEIDFSHGEYSIQIRNKNILTLNWYEPELTDIEWSLEFMGVKSLKHVSISHHQRRRVRLLFWRVNALHFFEGELKVRQRSSGLRKSIVQSERVIPLSLQTQDQVLFISKDLFPQEKRGIFFIETLNRKFYVLMAAQKKQQLIDLNYPSKISRFFSSVTGFWTPMIEESEVQNKIVSNVLIRNIPDEESFKSITLRDFQIEIRFVNIPLHPGEKCKAEAYQLYSVNLREIVYKELEEKCQAILIHSALYRSDETQIVPVFLLKSLNQAGEFFLVTLPFDFKKIQLKEIRHIKFSRNGLHTVCFEKEKSADQLIYLIVKEEYKQETILHKIFLKELQVLESTTIHSEGHSIFCSSQENSHLLLLCPYKIFQINFRKSEMIAQDSESIMEEEEIQIQRLSSVQEISNSVSVQKPILEKYFRQDNYQKILQGLSILADQVINRISLRKQSNNQNDNELRQLLKCWTAVNIYECILKHEQQNLRKVSNEYRTFKDLQINNKRNDYHEISAIFDQLIHHNQAEDMISIWNDFLNLYNYSEYLSDEKIRAVESSILEKYFEPVINTALQKVQTNSKQALKLIQKCNGVVQIQRQIYRKFIENKQNIKVLKDIALKKNNFKLIEIIYFETDQMIKTKDIQASFDFLRTQRPRQLFQKQTQNFVNQYISRAKTNKFQNEEAKKFTNILAIFPEELDFIRKIFEDHESDLDILIGLRQGHRKEIKEKIQIIANKMKTNQNKQKLLLTIQDL